MKADFCLLLPNERNGVGARARAKKKLFPSPKLLRRRRRRSGGGRARNVNHRFWQRKLSPKTRSNTRADTLWRLTPTLDPPFPLFRSFFLMGEISSAHTLPQSEQSFEKLASRSQGRSSPRFHPKRERESESESGRTAGPLQLI